MRSLCHGLCELHFGDALEVLRTLPDESVNCCVTSPPYWGLRNYGVEGEYGSEPTIAAYVEDMTAVFREVRRVLRKDGTCWLNLGDTYASGSSWSDGDDTRFRDRYKGLTADHKPGRGNNLKPHREKGLKPKDHCMIPARVALALQADGWWLRDEIIWHKPNPMPSSVTDRTTPAHEMIYLLTKSARYWYDAAAIRSAPNPETGARRRRADATIYEPDGQPPHTGIRAYKMPDNWDTGPGAHGAVHRNGREKGRPAGKNETIGEQPNGAGRFVAGLNERYDERESAGHYDNRGANARSVWPFSTEAFKEAHFATFPRELPKRCILAGCAPGGTVLDPFAGSGTTLAVAVELGRKAVGIELNADYARMSEKRVNGVTPALLEVA